MSDNENKNGEQPTTKVVNLYKDDYDVYIGRAGRGESGSFGNPFSIKQFGRDGSIEKFKEYFLRRVEDDLTFRDKVLDLRGKTLGCFCAPKRCHGEVIVEWLEEQNKEWTARARAEASKPHPNTINENKHLHLRALAMKMTPNGITTEIMTPEERDNQLSMEKQRQSLRMD